MAKLGAYGQREFRARCRHCGMTLRAAGPRLTSDAMRAVREHVRSVQPRVALPAAAQAGPILALRHESGAVMTWTPERERRAIVEHLARCHFCRALVAHSHRHQDSELLDAAKRLAWEHAANDAEREAFAQTMTQDRSEAPAAQHDTGSATRPKGVTLP